MSLEKKKIFFIILVIYAIANDVYINILIAYDTFTLLIITYQSIIAGRDLF